LFQAVDQDAAACLRAFLLVIEPAAPELRETIIASIAQHWGVEAFVECARALSAGEEHTSSPIFQYCENEEKCMFNVYTRAKTMQFNWGRSPAGAAGGPAPGATVRPAPAMRSYLP
jgi:hypothetical protein